MAELGLEGAGLKKMIKKARKAPIAFAFVPAQKDEDSVFAMNLKKSPEALGRGAKKEGDGSKNAFGTCLVKGKEMQLTCLRVVPGLAKRVKRFLKSQKAPYNIVIMDKDGNILESDIEDLPDDPLYTEPDDDDDGFEGTDVPDTGPQGGDEDEGGEPNPADALLARLADLRGRAEAVQGPQRDAFLRVATAAAGLIQSAEFPRATTTLDTLEKALDDAKAGAAPDAERRRAIAARIAALRPRVEGMAGPAGERFGLALVTAEELLAGSALDRAEKALDGIEKALDSSTPDPLAAEWGKTAARLVPLATQAISEKRGDFSRFQTILAVMQEAAGAGDFKKALDIAGRLEPAILQALGSGTTDQQANIPRNAAGLGRARLVWGKAREKLREEMATLRSAIVNKLKPMGDEFSGIEQESLELFKYLDIFDSKLESTIEELEKTPEGDKRTALKGEAETIVTDYLKTLNAGFFVDVDTNNGFASVKVRATAVAALGEVQRQLAA